MTQEEYIKLYEKYQEGKLTEDEKRSLLNYYDDFELAEYQWDDEKMGVKANVQAEIYNQISKDIHKTSSKRNFTWLAAASLLLAVFSLAYYFQSQDKNINENQIVKKSAIQEGIKPGKNGAILKLSDGSEIVLNEMKDGFVKYDGNTKINKQDNLISYRDRGNDNAGKTVFNVIYTPRGGQYRVELEDGTKVWLNAASSLRFPTVFNDDQRVVELSGEAYFEVAKNKTKPFKVLVKDASNIQKMNVEVLGTHFNIQAYNNEDFKTTLVEGAVKVNQTQQKGFILSPGEQATLSSSDLTVQKANVKEALAWKNGLFIFDKEHIKTIMNKIARWYDVEIVYEGNMDQKTFVGTISREENLSEVLKMLELTGTIKFKVEGRKVIVK